MIEILSEHFWACWWLIVIIACNLPDIHIHKDKTQ